MSVGPLGPDIDHATPTFVRATVAAARLSTGLWNLGVAIDTPRSHYLANGLYAGYLSEAAATQLALNPRDMTQAAWVAVNVTAAQSSTGIDGVATSCTNLTATAGNGTVLQTVVAAASTRTYSAFVKRITGTGTITLTNGVSTLDITALINTNTFTLVQLADSTLNTAFGFTIATSGDSIDVDCNQFEAGTFATTPIPAAGTRAADKLTYAILENDMQSGVCYGVFSTFFQTAPADAVIARQSQHSTLFGFVPSGAVSTVLSCSDNTNIPSVTSSDAFNTLKPFASSWDDGLSALSIVTGNNTNTTTFTNVMSINSTLGIGCNSAAGGQELNGTVKDLKFWAQSFQAVFDISYLSSITQ